MALIQIHNEQLARRLQELAARENRPIEEILQMLLDRYTDRAEALKAMDGMFDDEVTDLSASVRETMSSYYQRRDENPD